MALFTVPCATWALCDSRIDIIGHGRLFRDSGQPAMLLRYSFFLLGSGHLFITLRCVVFRDAWAFRVNTCPQLQSTIRMDSSFLVTSIANRERSFSCGVGPFAVVYRRYNVSAVLCFASKIMDDFIYIFRDSKTSMCVSSNYFRHIQVPLYRNVVVLYSESGVIQLWS